MFSEKPFPIIGIVYAGTFILSLPLSQTLLIGPIRNLPQQGISGKLLMTGRKSSVYAWKIYIMRNSLYFICILIGFCQRIFGNRGYDFNLP